MSPFIQVGNVNWNCLLSPWMNKKLWAAVTETSWHLTLWGLWCPKLAALLWDWSWLWSLCLGFTGEPLFPQVPSSCGRDVGEWCFDSFQGLWWLRWPIQNGTVGVGRSWHYPILRRDLLADACFSFACCSLLRPHLIHTIHSRLLLFACLWGA